MNRIILYIASALLLALSCQKQDVESVSRMVSLPFYLENAPVEENAGTKASVREVDVNEFTVRAISGRDAITGENHSYSFLYKDIVANENIIEVEVGIYTFSAENVSKADALSKPTAWGQPRYYAASEPTVLVTGTEEYPLEAPKINLVCKMVNSAVHVDFDDSIEEYFDSYRVSIYTDEDRRFEYNVHNTTDTYTPVAYFEPQPLYYRFYGVIRNSSDPYELKGGIKLDAATNHYLNFRIDRNPGEFDIDIIVDTDFEPIYESAFIEPDFNQN